MNIYKSFDEIPYNHKTILTVGTYDGVHSGHQKIIKKLLEYSEKHQLRNLIITFDPHPQIVLQKEGKPKIKLLSTIEERLELFEKYGIDNVLIVPFSNEFSMTTPKKFITHYLSKIVGFSMVLIGYDHLFGKNREGSIDLLNKFADKNNYKVEKISALQLSDGREDTVLSSTKIRRALDENNLDLANKYLGYNYIVKGKVIDGDKRGKTIGFPTANIFIMDENKYIPAKGVYFVSIIIDGKKYFGMANLGNRPTFVDSNQVLIEVNIFEFDVDIYGEIINVEFIKYLRKEKKFNSREKIIEQITIDRQECKKLVKSLMK